MEHRTKSFTLPYPRLTSEWNAAGVSTSTLVRNPRYTALTNGVWIDSEDRSTGTFFTWVDDAWFLEVQRTVAIQKIIPHARAEGISAARIYGWPLPYSFDGRPLHVSIPYEANRIRRRGVVTHRSRETAADTRYGCVLDSPCETIARLAGELTLLQLVQIIDAAIGEWHGPAQATLEDVQEYIGSHRRFPGRKLLRKAMTMARVGVDSPRETSLRLRLVDEGFPEPVVHPPVFCHLINKSLEPDVGYDVLKVGVEYDGDYHRDNDRLDLDASRRNLMESEGWTLLQVTKRTNWNQFCAILAGYVPRSNSRGAVNLGARATSH